MRSRSWVATSIVTLARSRPGEHRDQRGGARAVEGGGRLVEDQQARASRDGARDRDADALAAGEGVG